MPNLVTKKFKIHNAEQFMESLNEAVATNLFFFIGKVDKWEDETNVPAPTDSFANTNYDYWNQMIACKKIQPSNVSFVLPRYNWSYNTSYSAYNHTNNELFQEKFYVVTDDFNVYKCLQNNISNGASTVKPTGQGLNVIETSDGYKWKFMYSIVPQDVLKFSTSELIPVKKTTTDDVGSKQYEVESNAVDGAIDIINKTANGDFRINFTNGPTDINGETQNFLPNEILEGVSSKNRATLISHSAGANTCVVRPDNNVFVVNEEVKGITSGAKAIVSEIPTSTYLFDEGTLTSVQNSSVILLSTTANNTVDNLYVGSTIFITNNAAQGEKTKIVQYDSVLRRATVSPSFLVTPNTSSGYIISPSVNVTGTGITATARAIGNNSHGVTDIVVLNKGLNYTNASVTFTANSSHGSGASGLPIIGPIGGHGKNALEELGGNKVIVDIRLSGNESSYFTTENDYRQVGLLRDPRSLEDANNFYTAPLSDQATTITIGNISGQFLADEEVYVGDNLSTALAKGILIDFRNQNTLRLSNVVGDFSLYAITGTTTINGETSGATAQIAKIGVTKPGIKPYSGDILYVENRQKVSRLNDQVENYKIVLEF